MHINKAKIGEMVRSYDFQPMPDRGECYIEGIVFAKDDGLFSIAVQNRVFDGNVEPVEVGEIVRTPFELMMMEYEGRIQKIGLHGLEAA